MADVTKVQMLIDQSRKLLEDHPYDEADPMTYIVSLDVFHDELKFIIKALEEPVDITGVQLLQCLKDAGLENVRPHIRFIEK